MMYALVQWISGEDVGKRTILDAAWIIGFCEDNFENYDDESFVVEWRDKKKPPWKLYDATIIAINKKHSVLEKQMFALESKQSHCFNDSSSSSKDGVENEVKQAGKRKQQDYDREDQLSILDRTENTVGDLKETIVHLKRKYQEKKQENKRLQSILTTELPKMMDGVNTLIKIFALPVPIASSSPKSLKMQTVSDITDASILKDKNNSPKIELYPGAEIMVDKVAMNVAKNSKSASSFIGILLQNLFPTDVLLNSNLRGGSNKVNPAAEKKNPLDPAKMDALLNATMMKFPDTTKSAFGIAVNNKLAFLRFRNKQ